MTDLTRRSLLGTSTALAVGVPASGAVLANPDTTPGDNLLTLEAELHTASAIYNSADGDEDDDWLFQRIVDLEWQIARAPAKTLAGVAVKLRRLRVSLDIGDTEWDETNLETAVAALSWLQGRAS